MSLFDTLAAAYADDLVAHLGDEAAAHVLVADKYQPFPAIVGRLRVENVEVARGTSVATEQREVCQVSLRCPAGTIHPKTRLWLRLYAATDEFNESEVFYVRTIDSVTPGLTTVQAWREMLAKVQRRKVES